MSALRRIACAVACVGLVLGAPACNTTRRLPVLGAGPYVTRDGLVLDRVVAAVQEAGYLPRDIDEARGRFEVVAQGDLHGQTRFVVQCTSDGWIVVLPEGPGIERHGGHTVVPGHVAIEYASLVIALESGVAVRPR